MARQRPSDEEIQVRIEAIVEKHHGLVEKFGWSATSVFPTETDSGFHITYTHGLSLKGRPELISYGLAGHQIHAVFQKLIEFDEALKIFDRVDTDGVYDTSLKELFDQTDEEFNAPIRLIDVSEAAEPRSDMAMTRRMYPGRDFRIFQVLWGDDEGRLPIDPNFTSLAKQPIYGRKN